LGCIAAALFVAGAAWAAEMAALPLAEATIRFDRTRYIGEPAGDAIRFVPLAGAQDHAQHRDRPRHTVIVRAVPARAAPTCLRLVQDAFGSDLYDISSMKTWTVTIGGRKAMRASAHTRCRNATPTGEVACVRGESHVYLLEELQRDCQSGFPFQHADALGEIAAGLSMPPPR
jgi:hypothetical protein